MTEPRGGDRRAPIEIAAEPPGAERRAPVDLVHLARQTFGSIELEREVLDLFVRHGAGLVAEILKAETPAQRAQALHRLKGSAAGIGARRVATIVRRLEGTDETAPETAALLDELGVAVDEVARFVETLWTGTSMAPGSAAVGARLGA
jgi:HPt (histidine-containing phosphotransfer) domain-containing protein